MFSTFSGKLFGPTVRQLHPIFNQLNRRLLVIMATSEAGNKPVKQIGTHNGVFHCDDVFACYLLKQLPEYHDAKIIRTRDASILDQCDIVVDVGSIYDHSKRRYDHHQRDFNLSLKDLDPKRDLYDIKLSSAGLIYHHYGRSIVSRLLGLDNQTNGDGCGSYQIELLFDKVYESFVQEIDAIDNGISICDGKPRYMIHSDLSSRVGHLKPNWNEESNDDILYERFLKAIDLVGKEFEDRVNYYGKAWYPAKMLVKEAIVNRGQVHKSGAIIELSKAGGPWKDHLFTLEEELGIEGKIKFSIFQDTQGSWRVAGVPIFPKSFQLRCPLYNGWRGLRDRELSEKSGIPGCIFVHSSGFIGGAESREAVIAMAEKTLELSPSNNENDPDQAGR